MEEPIIQTLTIEITQIIATTGSHYHPNVWKNKERGWYYQNGGTWFMQKLEPWRACLIRASHGEGRATAKDTTWGRKNEHRQGEIPWFSSHSPSILPPIVHIGWTQDCRYGSLGNSIHRSQPHHSAVQIEQKRSRKRARDGSENKTGTHIPRNKQPKFKELRERELLLRVLMWMTFGPKF